MTGWSIVVNVGTTKRNSLSAVSTVAARALPTGMVCLLASVARGIVTGSWVLAPGGDPAKAPAGEQRADENWRATGWFRWRLRGPRA